MEDQIQAVPNVDLAKQQKQQFRAMCVDFATRVKDVNQDTIITIAEEIEAYISGDTE